jgi:hypothetical protein
MDHCKKLSDILNKKMLNHSVIAVVVGYRAHGCDRRLKRMGCMQMTVSKRYESYLDDNNSARILFNVAFLR